MKRSILWVVLLIAGSVATAGERPMFVRGARALGMGDAFTAVADDQNVFFYNPAGAVQRTGAAFTLLDIPISAGSDLKEVIDFISDNEDSLKNFDSLSLPEQSALLTKIDQELVPLRPVFGFGAPNISYLSGPMGAGFHWGAGLFGQANGQFGFVSGSTEPVAYYDLNADASPMAFLAKRFDSIPLLPGKLGVGATYKYLRRAQAQDASVTFSDLDNFNEPPLQQGRGHGLDLGAFYQPTNRIRIAAALLDFGGTSIEFDATAAENGFSAQPARSETIPARLNCGIAWTPARLGIGPIGLPTGDRLTLAADFRDLGDADKTKFIDGSRIDDSALKRLHVGAEYRWWFLRARGGINQGFPAVGIGIDVPLLKLDYAYYQEEVGGFGGSDKKASHILSLALRFGTGSTEAQQRIKDGTPTTPEAKTEAAPPAAETPAPGNP